MDNQVNFYFGFWRDSRSGKKGVDCLRKVSGEELGHGEGRGEELLLLGVLAVVLLKVGPQLLDALSPCSFLLSDDVGELGGELHGLGESGSLSRHG